MTDFMSKEQMNLMNNAVNRLLMVLVPITCLLVVQSISIVKINAVETFQRNYTPHFPTLVHQSRNAIPDIIRNGGKLTKSGGR